MAPDARTARRPNLIGPALAVIGVVAVLLAFTVFAWFGSSGATSIDDGNGSTFGGIHDVLARVALVSDSGVEARAVPMHYFSWLGWVLLVVVALAAGLATVPNPVTGVARVAGPLLALLSIAITFVAIDLVSVSAGVAEQTGSTPTYSEYLEHAGPGFYVAVAGFVVAGLAAVVGPRRGWPRSG